MLLSEFSMIVNCVCGSEGFPGTPPYTAAGSGPLGFSPLVRSRSREHDEGLAGEGRESTNRDGEVRAASTVVNGYKTVANA